jgi:hypothetical protein
MAFEPDLASLNPTARAVKALAEVIRAPAQQPPVNSTILAEIGLDAAGWMSLVRSRRLRVLDWAAASGLSLLNLVDGVREKFLDDFMDADLSDKYSVALRLGECAPCWLALDTPWSKDLASYQAHLVWIRQERARPVLPSSPDQYVKLAAGCRFFTADPKVVQFQASVPSYSIGAAKAREFLDSLTRSLTDFTPQSQILMAVPRFLPRSAPTTVRVAGSGGRIIALEADVGNQLIALATQRSTWGDLRKRLGAQISDNLLSMQLVTLDEEACA